MEAVLGAIIQENSRRCNCLEKVTDAILGFMEEMPEMEEVLINFGVIETTSKLLPGVEGL